MKLGLFVSLCVALVASPGWGQTARDAGEPSPMEAFAHQAGVRTTWSNQVARIDLGGAHIVVTALVLAGPDDLRDMRGVRIDLANLIDTDAIYLDLEATERTRAALQEIAAFAGRRGSPALTACLGAREFWPGYNWAWNKYHELNADLCGDRGGTALVLHGRHRPAAYWFPGESPEHFAEVLTEALKQLKQQ